MCCAAEDANIIAENMNVVNALNVNLLVVGTVWRKCGVTRAIVKVEDDFVHYENVSNGTITRVKGGKFIDWMWHAEMIRVGHPTR